MNAISSAAALGVRGSPLTGDAVTARGSQREVVADGLSAELALDPRQGGAAGMTGRNGAVAENGGRGVVVVVPEDVVATGTVRRARNRGREATSTPSSRRS